MSKRNALRNFLMHAFHLMVTMVIGNHIRDTQCGFKVQECDVVVCEATYQRSCPFG
jgi:hypothetical protein